MSDDRQHPASLRSKDASRSLESSGKQKRESQRVRPTLGSLFEPGARVGRYRLLVPLACGGMAQVWAAKPETQGFARTIALKLIRQEYASDEEYSRLFIDEATIAASIHHPNVCETYELGREQGILFMALEWVAGDSLAGLLHRETGLEPIAVPLAARIVADASAGLHAAHEAVGSDGKPLGVVHRDVSPPNILLSLHGQVKVSDFGIAKARHQLHSATFTGEIKGKFAYIAPEQIGGKNPDRRADIFALGCVLYVATLGLRPFGSGPKAMAKILAGEYKRPRSLVSTYPEELERIIERCLQRLPADRYQTADEVRLDLERWLLACDTPVGTKDLALLVNERLEPTKRRVVETLLRANQFLPDAMVYQLVSGEVEQTPTANSSVVFSPSSIPASGAPSSQRRSDGHSGQKPMVRFTALGKEVVSNATGSNGEVGDGTERTETSTPANGVVSSPLPPSRSESLDADLVPTFRPQIYGRRAIGKAGDKVTIRATFQRFRRRIALGALVLGGAVLVWLICSLFVF